MKLQSAQKPSILYAGLVFTGFMLLFNLVVDLIAASFKLDYFMRKDYLIYDIGFEAAGLFVAAIGTAFISQRFSDFHWRSVFFRVLIFAAVYTAFGLLLTFLFYLAFVGTDFTFLKLNFKVFITGMKAAFIFIVFWNVIKYKNR